MSINKQSAFNKFKNNSYCVGGKHFSATTNIRGNITQNKKTGLPIKLLRGTCTTYKRNKSLIVSDQTNMGKDWETSSNIWVLQPKTLERKYSIIQAAHWK